MATMKVPKSTFFKEIREVRADANAFKTYSGVQEIIFSIANSGVTELKLGGSYWIILQKGTDSLDLLSLISQTKEHQVTNTESQMTVLRYHHHVFAVQL